MPVTSASLTSLLDAVNIALVVDNCMQSCRMRAHTFAVKTSSSLDVTFRVKTIGDQIVNERDRVNAGMNNKGRLNDINHAKHHLSGYEPGPLSHAESGDELTRHYTTPSMRMTRLSL